MELVSHMTIYVMMFKKFSKNFIDVTLKLSVCVVISLNV